MTAIDFRAKTIGAELPACGMSDENGIWRAAAEGRGDARPTAVFVAVCIPHNSELSLEEMVRGLVIIHVHIVLICPCTSGHKQYRHTIHLTY